jgi:type VI secretion system secreted protein VgrG
LTRANIPAAFGSTGLEIYDYPGKYDSAAVGTQISRARMESLHGQSEQIAARTNARGLCAGSLFSLFQHPRDDHNRSYLVTGTQHWITAGDYLSGDNNHTTFDCTLTAIGDKHPYRPPQSYAKPIVHGPQTATVVGKAGQEVWTDSFGRVKVQFHWDRAGMSDERSSCWVRVAQGWAGRGWGSQFLPRIGMEVVVSFLEGDPDRPLITGCVYNSSNEFPYELPANHSQSGVKSRSTLNSAGFNELRFEDKAGAEEVYMHAEKNFIREIKSDDIHTIGQDQKTSIARDQVATISRNQTMTVGEDQTMNVSGDQKVTVGNTIAITATTAIELKVGGSSIKIEPEKITIKSMTINIESTANTTIKGSIVDIN